MTGEHQTNVGAIHESPLPDFIKGADLSSLLEVEACGGRFYDDARRGEHCSPEKTSDPVISTLGRCLSPDAEETDSSTPLRSAQNDIPGGAEQSCGRALLAPTAENALVILQRNGVNFVRVRLWNDP